MTKRKLLGAALVAFLTAVIPLTAFAGEIEEHHLKNGLRVLTLEDHSAPIISFNIWYDVGSRNETMGITGISHLLEHMMFKGSKNYEPEEHSKIVTQNGGYDNAMTYTDYTGYYCVLPAEKIELAMKLESDRMVDLTLPENEFQSERDVVIEERRFRTDNNTVGRLLEQLWALSFHAHSLQHPIVGWMSDIKNVTRDRLYEYYRTYYAPNNATMIIVGDFETKKALKLVKKYFAHIPSRELPPPIYTEEPEQKGKRMLKYHTVTQMPIIAAGYKIPGMGHEDYYPLEVISYILSAGESSRMYKKLVYEDQSSLYAGGWADAHRDYGLFILYAALQPANDVEDVEKALYAELDRIKNEPVSDMELEKAKNQLEAENIFSLESNEDKARTIGYAEFVQRDYRLYDEAAEKIRAVTKEEIMETAKKYFHRDKRNVVYLLPEVEERPEQSPSTDSE